MPGGRVAPVERRSAFDWIGVAGVAAPIPVRIQRRSLSSSASRVSSGCGDENPFDGSEVHRLGHAQSSPCLCNFAIICLVFDVNYETLVGIWDDCSCDLLRAVLGHA